MLTNLLQDCPTTTRVSFCVLYLQWGKAVLFALSQLQHEERFGSPGSQLGTGWLLGHTTLSGGHCFEQESHILLHYGYQVKKKPPYSRIHTLKLINETF